MAQEPAHRGRVKQARRVTGQLGQQRAEWRVQFEVTVRDELEQQRGGEKLRRGAEREEGGRRDGAAGTVLHLAVHMCPGRTTVVDGELGAGNRVFTRKLVEQLCHVALCGQFCARGRNLRHRVHHQVHRSRGSARFSFCLESPAKRIERSG